ncbi:hypothetical protein V8C86DRAFT_2684981 [Haematococcus lacustris]
MPDVNAPVPGDSSLPAGDPAGGRLPSARVRPPVLPSFGKTVARFPFKAGPDIRGAALPTDVSRYQMMAMDPSIAKAQLHSTVCPKTDATEKSLLKSTFAFFFEAHLKGVYADGITVPLCYKGLLRELLVDVSDDIQDITHHLYVWVNERAADLCVLFCAYAARKCLSHSPVILYYVCMRLVNNGQLYSHYDVMLQMRATPRPNNWRPRF